MRNERHAPPRSPKRLAALLAAQLVAALCLASVCAAQSGRKGKLKDPPVNAAPTAEAQPEAAPRITSIIVCGHDLDPLKGASNYISSVFKAIDARMKERPDFALEIKYRGKMTRAEAVELAKHETDAYVLWFGYSTQVADHYETTIHHFDYIVFRPQTAKKLTEGRVYPAERRTTIDPGDIIHVPTAQPRSRPSNAELIESGGRKIADRVRNKL